MDLGGSVWRSPCDDPWIQCWWDGLEIVNLFPDADRHHSLLFVIQQRDNVNSLQQMLLPTETQYLCADGVRCKKERLWLYWDRELQPGASTPALPRQPSSVTHHSTRTQRHVPRLSWWLVHLSITYLLPTGYRYVYYLTGHRTQCRLRAHCCITACPYVTPCPVSSVQAAADCHDSWHDANRSVQRSCFVCLPHWHCYNLIVMIHIIF